MDVNLVDLPEQNEICSKMCDHELLEYYTDILLSLSTVVSNMSDFSDPDVEVTVSGSSGVMLSGRMLIAHLKTQEDFFHRMLSHVQDRIARNEQESV